MSLYSWIMSRPVKPPRAKKVCVGCGGPFGLVRPHRPYCTRECKEKHEEPEQHEMDYDPVKHR
jgi:hypothetical protein